ncbi:tetratricopeptide repeat protein [Glycomyces sp. NPDC047369]
MAESIPGIASTGNHAINTQHVTALPAEALVAPEAVPIPAGLVNLPVRLRPFVGREDALSWLNSTAQDPGMVVVQALHGLGGIGKSTLVAHWAATHRDGHRPIWWITADSPAALDAGLVALTVALQPALGAALPSPALREWVIRWLACHDGWLLILDNVTNPAHITDLVGRLPRGRILVTSRRATGWPDIVTLLRLDVLEPGQAVDLLTGIVFPTGAPIDPAGAAAVCTELGYLPLAVEQAGAYLAQTHTPVSEYLRLFTQHPADMYRDGEEGRAAERTIARVWQVTLSALADDPLPGRLLRALAWYAPEAIPHDLWHHLGEGEGDPAVVRAIGRLAAYNMLTIDPTSRAVTVHRLVQAVARTPEPDDPHRQPDDITTARATATTALITALPDDGHDPTTWPTCRTLLPHIDALATHAKAHTTDSDRIAQAYLLNAAGLFLRDEGNLLHAIAYLKQALTDRRRALGNDHPGTLASVNNLASAYESAGNLRRAIPLYEQALTDCQRVLGNDHPGTLAMVNNLAGAYESAGDLLRAIPLYEQALTDCRRVLGNDHPSTLVSVNNLAYAYKAAGDLRRAIPLYEQALTDRRRVLGNDHPSTLVSVNNLAGAYGSAGDLLRAIPLYEQALTDCQQALGNDHPQTLMFMNNLADAYKMAGDLRRAIPLHEQALTDRRRVLGNDHPNTLVSVNNLAGAYKAAGDLRRAIPLHEQALTDCQRVLGNDHPDTLASANSLAGAYLAAGDLQRAVPLYEQSFTDCQRVLGNDHPNTLASANNLAGAYKAAGDLQRAIPLYKQALTDCQRVLGNDHPDTLAILNNLAYAHKAAGDLWQATSLYEQALTDQRPVLGNDHPQIIQGNLRAANESSSAE